MKQFKKVVASALALAMVVTAIPTADAQAAAKAPKLNNTKKILYVGQSYTLKVNNLPANWKKCTYTWSTSNKSIATIKKGKYGQAASVKAVKAGKTTITTKMTYPQTAAQKKAKKKTVKTFKCAVTVKNPTLTVKASATTLAVGKTTKLSVSKAPSNAKVAFSSSDKTVATVSSNGTVKAVASGKAVITVTSTVGTKKLTKKVTITVAGEEGITAALANPLSSEYPNTVLVSDQAVIKVSVVEDGKPVAGRTIVGTITKTEGQALAGYTVNGEPTGDKPSYEIKGNNAAVTDANGVATFVIGNTKSNVKSYDIQYASVNFKAQDANSSKTIESIVSFATVKNADIKNINNHNDDVDVDKKDNLVPGVNYNTAGHDGLALTASMDAPHSDNDEYVESQQVSSADADEHKVGFTGGYPEIYLPDTAGDLSNASKEVEEINHKSDAYHTYANDSYYYTIKKDPSKLTYATINFDNVTISKYTKLVVETFKSEADAKAETTVPSDNSLDKKEYRGELTQSSFAYQVPLNTTYKGLCVKVTLVSQGQVDAAKNAGYNVKNITYVYKTQTGTTPEPLPLKGATMSWSIVDTPMTAEEDIFTTSTQTTTRVGNTMISVQAGGKITKKVPAFPYTGPAVITVYDANGKVVSYYACATKNKGNNTNDIYNGASCYEISVDELRDKVGEIVSQDTTSVWVDSKKSGRTTLEGTVKVDGKELQLDAETNTVYTSVQWNPIPKAATVTASDAFVALLGQKIEVVAQLTDKNGNAVTLPDQGITFSYTKQRPTTTTPIDLSPAGDKIVEGTVSGKDATIVSGQSKTDSNGQSKLILKASDITEITNITAESQNAGYDVVLKVADKTTKQADLYWIDADLAFVDSAYNSKSYTTANKPIETVTTGIEPKVGETWEYGVKTVGTVLAKADGYKGALADKTINIDNLGITMTKTSDSVGTVDTNTGVNGMVKATSTKASTTKIVSTIDAKTLTDKVTVSQGTFAGTGAASVSKKLTLNVNWKNDGMSAEVLSPAGTFVYGNSTTVYVKVADAYGNAPKNATDVTFKVDDATAQLDREAVGASKTVPTDSDGIAKVTLTKGASSKRTTVVATVSGISDNVFAQTYNWVTTADITSDLEIEKNANAETGKYQTVFDKDTKTITMTFTDDILPSSVVKEQFAVAYDSNTYVVDEATVNNNVITLKLADVPVTTSASKNFTVTITSELVKGVTYTVTSVQGVQLCDGEVITFAADKGNSAPSQAKSTTYSTDKKTTTDANSSAITTDASTLVTDLTALKDEMTLTKMQGIIGAGGKNDTSFALTKVSDAKGILDTDGTITCVEADAEATFTVTVSKGTGSTAGKSVTKTFKVKINAGNNGYTVTEVL